jgi:C-terminal processing protease CtpA/Prc
LTEELQNLNSEMAALRTAVALEQSRAPGLAEARALTDSIQALRGLPSRQTPNADHLVERLVAGGFTRERAEWIRQRTDEMTMAAIEVRDASVRDNTDPAAASFQIFTRGPGPALRAEMGDMEYEQYLRAIGRDPAVDIDEVLENSPASLAGLQAGDQIVYYGGTRVFEFTEVTPLTTQGRQGESVVVEILRDGQPMQIVVPRGPLGVRLSSGDSIAIGVVQPQ